MHARKRKALLLVPHETEKLINYGKESLLVDFWSVSFSRMIFGRAKRTIFPFREVRHFSTSDADAYDSIPRPH